MRPLMGEDIDSRICPTNNLIRKAEEIWQGKRFKRYLAWLHQPFRSNSPELERRGARELKQEQHMMDAAASAPFLNGWVPGCRA